MGFVRVKLTYSIFFPQKRRSKCNGIFVCLMLLCMLLLQISYCSYCPGPKIKMLQKFLHWCPFLSQNVLGIRRYTVIFMVVPTEMKVIKSHASRNRLIAARVRKHFFSLHNFSSALHNPQCAVQFISIGLSLEAHWSFQDQHSRPEGSCGLIFLLLQQMQYCYD